MRATSYVDGDALTARCAGVAFYRTPRLYTSPVRGHIDFHELSLDTVLAPTAILRKGLCQTGERHVWDRDALRARHAGTTWLRAFAFQCDP